MLFHVVEFSQRESYILYDFRREGLFVFQDTRLDELLNSYRIANVTMNLWPQLLLRDMLINHSLGLPIKEQIYQHKLKNLLDSD